MDIQYRRRRSVQYLARDAQRFGSMQFWLAFRLLPGLLLISLTLLLFSAIPARASANAGEDILGELASGQLLWRNDATGGYTPALIQSSKAHFDISGMIATVSVEQRFRNDTDRWLEGVYAFPLPEDAAVRAMEMRIGERRIVGKIKEKAAARKIYQQAKQSGKKASLVEQQRPNLFTNRVANIGPGEEVVVKLEYVQPVDYRAGEFSLRFPTTITPRYMPGSPPVNDADPELVEKVDIDPYLGWAVATDQVPDADAISPLLIPQAGTDLAPLNPLEITVRLDMGMPLARVDAPYHELAMARRAGVYDIRLSNGVTEMNRDFVLSWEPVTGSAPSAAMFTEQVGDDHFGLLMVLPPAAGQRVQVLSRELIFVVDTSGSMGGVAIEQARQSVARALQQLRPQDRFNIIEFNSNHRALYRSPMPATPHHVQQAQEFVRYLQASGGTEMLSALRAALAPGQEDAYRDQAALRQIIFITDGAVGNEVALFEEISSNLGDSRLFTIGIGSAPNSWFMREAARFGRGTHVHIGKVGEVEQKMVALFEQLARPLAVDLEIAWPGGVEAWPERVPDLYAGQPLLVAVNFGQTAPQGEVTVSARLDGKSWSRTLQLATGADPLSSPQHKGVASLWGRQKIAALLEQIPRGGDEAAVRAEVLPVALQHHLLSPYTSFVAVEEVVSRPAGELAGRAALANTRPQGQTAQSYAYPRTATTGPARLWLGLLLLFLALLLHLVRTPEVDHVPTQER